MTGSFFFFFFGLGFLNWIALFRYLTVEPGAFYASYGKKCVKLVTREWIRAVCVKFRSGLCSVFLSRACDLLSSSRECVLCFFFVANCNSYFFSFSGAMLTT
jgi:hypothetical protein